MRRVIAHHPIVHVEVPPDDIVCGSTPPEAFVEALKGRTITDVGRKGKYWWLEFDGFPWVYGHLGMSGWIRQVGTESRRLHSHGDAPLDDQEGRPRFLKLLIEVEGGGAVAFTDGRRLGRLWLGTTPAEDPAIRKLGFDCYDELPKPKELFAILQKRKAPIKAILLDQGIFAGVGNWIADETLYQARINPKRLGNSLTEKEVTKLRNALHDILKLAVEVDADYHKFPESWMFVHRWGGSKGSEMIDGNPIVRETVGGRTTAWVPKVQK